MSICIYVYMYICIYICIYVCMYMYIVELVAGPLAIPFHLQIVNGDPLIPNQIGPPQPKRSCSLFWLRSHCSKRLGASLSPRAEIPEPACLCMEMPYTCLNYARHRTQKTQYIYIFIHMYVYKLYMYICIHVYVYI